LKASPNSGGMSSRMKDSPMATTLTVIEPARRSWRDQFV
jgi:hypothetical protein